MHSSLESERKILNPVNLASEIPTFCPSSLHLTDISSFSLKTFSSPFGALHFMMLSLAEVILFPAAIEIQWVVHGPHVYRMHAHIDDHSNQDIIGFQEC